MKILASLALAISVNSNLMFAEERDGVRVTDSTSSFAYTSNNPTSLSATQSFVWVGLNGICAAPWLRIALIEIRIPGQEIRCAMREGETVAGIELLAIHAGRGKATIRHRGSTNEIALFATANISGTVKSEENFPETEKQKDVSHSEYHRMRALLDRERDASQAAASQPE